jgi:hypothetical protein
MEIQQHLLSKSEVIGRLNKLESICYKEANQNPVDKDLFQRGKQFAYSHLYFELKPITKSANWVKSDVGLYKIAVPLMAFCIGAIIGIYYF